MVVDTGFYDTLNVTPDASDSEIKKNFYKLAKQCHPDKNSDPGAEEKFKAINEAYEVLSDPEKRQRYDAYGKDGVDQHGDMEDFLRRFHETGGGRFSFGGGFPFSGRSKGRPMEPMMPDLAIPIEMTLPEIYAGKKAQFNAARYTLKEGMTPTKEDMFCTSCKGQGLKIEMRPIGPGVMQQIQKKCDACQGQRIIISDAFFDKTESILSKTIPKGVIRGQKIVVKNQGHYIPECMARGNQTRTNLIIAIKEHTVYTVEVASQDDPSTVIDEITYERGWANSPFNLKTSIKLSAAHAICGGAKEMMFIDGSKFLLRIPPGLAFKEILHIIVPNKGMPVYSVVDEDARIHKYGDLYVEVDTSDVTLDRKTNELIYSTLTGHNMTKDIRRSKSNYPENLRSTAMPLDEYKTSARLQQVNRDFKQFDKNYEREMRGQDSTEDAEFDSSDDEIDGMGGMGGMGGMPGMGDGEGPPQCAQQ